MFRTFKFLFVFRDLLANTTLSTKLKSNKSFNKSKSASTYIQFNHLDLAKIEILSMP